MGRETERFRLMAERLGKTSSVREPCFLWSLYTKVTKDHVCSCLSVLVQTPATHGPLGQSVSGLALAGSVLTDMAALEAFGSSGSPEGPERSGLTPRSRRPTLRLICIELGHDGVRGAYKINDVQVGGLGSSASGGGRKGGSVRQRGSRSAWPSAQTLPFGHLRIMY